MAGYPAYVHRTLATAREQGQWYCGQMEAAALCFDVLADFPGCAEASELIYTLFCDEWLIYDNRNAIQQHIDEWDDRPWQQRRRLALSFRLMSRWENGQGRHSTGEERDGPPDVADLLHEAKMQLLHAYSLGDEECNDFAWPLFAEAFQRAEDPQRTLMWAGRLYADLGFFADAAEVLAELCSRYTDAAGRRLLAEVLWWRDCAHRIPWLPPPGDSSRYRRMMSFIDPDALDDEETIRRIRAGTAARGIQPPDWEPSISPALAALIAAAVPETSDAPIPGQPLVDWRFLDEDDGQPGELPLWAQKMLQRFPGHIPEDMIHRYRWSRPIPPPLTPPRRDPYEASSESAHFLGVGDDVEDEDWADLDDEDEDSE